MATQRQIQDLAATLVQTVPDGLPFDRAQWLIGHKGEWMPRVGEILVGCSVPDVAELLRDWEKFYLDVFGLQKDFSDVVVPPHRAGFDRLIVVMEGMTPNKVLRSCHDRFPTWSWTDDLDDEAVAKNDREPTRSYAVWVRDRVEADEELENFSAMELKERNVQGVTLLERLLLELKFHLETGGG